MVVSCLARKSSIEVRLQRHLVTRRDARIPNSIASRPACRCQEEGQSSAVPRQQHDRRELVRSGMTGGDFRHPYLQAQEFPPWRSPTSTSTPPSALKLWMMPRTTLDSHVATPPAQARKQPPKPESREFSESGARER